jgi:hypothetical protein
VSRLERKPHHHLILFPPNTPFPSATLSHRYIRPSANQSVCSFATQADAARALVRVFLLKLGELMRREGYETSDPAAAAAVLGVLKAQRDVLDDSAALQCLCRKARTAYEQLGRLAPGARAAAQVGVDGDAAALLTSATFGAFLPLLGGKPLARATGERRNLAAVRRLRARLALGLAADG